jgi:mevalonate pyrophosphate decarboxylase
MKRKITITTKSKPKNSSQDPRNTESKLEVKAQLQPSKVKLEDNIMKIATVSSKKKKAVSSKTHESKATPTQPLYSIWDKKVQQEEMKTINPYTWGKIGT